VCYPLRSLRRSVKFPLRRSVNYVVCPAAVRCGYFAVWVISARGVPTPVFNRLFLSCLPVVARPGPLRPAAISRAWLIFLSMTSCIHFSGCAASCVPRPLLRLHLLLPNLPLRPPAFSHLTHSLASPSSSAALLPRPSVSLLFCFRIRMYVIPGYITPCAQKGHTKNLHRIFFNART
jgi:hypothetical protein